MKVFVCGKGTPSYNMITGLAQNSGISSDAYVVLR